MSDVTSYIDLLTALLGFLPAYAIICWAKKTKIVVKVSLKLSKKKNKRK
jgi:hypothetical protein